MGIELRQLRHALALADHGTFGRAALVLELSQPALTRSIQALEREVGSPLFVRSPDGAVPTDVGRLFLQRARDIVRLAGELDEELVGARTLQSGRARIGAGAYPAEAIVAAAAARCARGFPNLTLDLVVGTWDELLQLLRGRELDLFIGETSTLQQDHDLDVEPLGRHPLLFVARRGHPLAGRRDVTAADTFSWPFVAPSRVPPRILERMLQAQRSATDPAARSRPFPSMLCRSLGTVKRIVEGSDAITGLTADAFADRAEASRFAVLGTEPWLHLQYGLVRIRDRPLSRAAEKFRELLFEAERETASRAGNLLARHPGRRRAGRTAGGA